MFTINGTNTPYIEDASTSTHFRTELANWDLFTTTLKANIAKSTILCSDTLKNIKKSIKSINILQSQSEPPERLNSTISTTNSLYTSNHTSLGQNAELDNSAPNSLIAQTAQLAIWTTVQENQPNQNNYISSDTEVLATSFDASIASRHVIDQDWTGDRATALITEDISTFQNPTDVTQVPFNLANQNNSTASVEKVGEQYFRASLAPVHSIDQPSTRGRVRASSSDKVRVFSESPITTIAQLSISATGVTDFLDLAAQELTSIIIESAKASIPTSKPGARAKPWWSHDLQELRQYIMRAQRLIIYSNTESVQQYLQAKNTYFQAIKQAKRDH
jgi:hypothetical protein